MASSACYSLLENLDPATTTLFELRQQLTGRITHRVEGVRTSSRRVLTDVDGQVLLTCKQAGWTLIGKHLVHSSGFSSQQRIGAVKPHARGGLAATVRYALPGSQPVTLCVDGAAGGTSATVRDEASGALVAQVDQAQHPAPSGKPSERTIDAEREAFVIRMQPGADAAAVLLAIVALESSFKMQYNPFSGIDGYSPFAFGYGPAQNAPCAVKPHWPFRVEGRRS